MTNDGHAAGEWDGHVLLLYHDEPDRLAAVAAWVRRGLERGEKVLYAPSPGDPDLETSLAQAGVDVEGATEDGRLSVLSLEDMYADQAGLVTRTLDAGFPGVRLSAKGAAGLPHVSRSDHQRAEREMDVLCARLPVSAMCQYDARLTVGDHRSSAVEVHSGAVHDGRMRLYREGDRLHLAGEVDLSSAELLGAALRRACAAEGGDSVTLDLSGLEFVGVAGWRALLLGTQPFRDAGGTVFLEAPRPHVRRMMAILQVGGQDHVFLV